MGESISTNLKKWQDGANINISNTLMQTQNLYWKTSICQEIVNLWPDCPERSLVFCAVGGVWVAVVNCSNYGHVLRRWGSGEKVGGRPFMGSSHAYSIAWGENEG